ncbi:MAG: hypothetical protein QF588_08115, partial [Candidatus Poseidoniaceae archaeon]|nr:hypothetical protein [Candidatus Poseidoniaceae archaeon]
LFCRFWALCRKPCKYWCFWSVSTAGRETGPRAGRDQSFYPQIPFSSQPQFREPINQGLWEKILKIKILKIKIRVAQNVGKVWISRKKSSWPHLGPSGPFFAWAGKIHKVQK